MQILGWDWAFYQGTFVETNEQRLSTIALIGPTALGLARTKDSVIRSDIIEARLPWLGPRFH